MAKAKRLADVDFGRLDAEADANLESYFVDTGVLTRLQRGEKSYVIGRKGSGKTAIFRLTSPARLKVPVLSLDFNEYPWEAHRRIREEGMVAESVYVASWRFMFLEAICKYWSSHFRDVEIAKSAGKLVARIYGEENPTLTEILFDKFKRLRKVDLPNAGDLGGLGGFELDESKAGPVLAQSISQWSRVLSDFVTEHFASDPLVVTLDRLDDGWDASTEAKMLLAGVLKAARDLNIKLRKGGQPAPVITFLRTDIYDELQFNDKNKISADIEFLSWDDGALVDIAEARIARSLEIPQNGAWLSVFSSAEMRQRATIQTYVLKRTMGRPRDIVAEPAPLS